MNWHDRITVDSQVCHGQACVKGTRVLATVLLDELAAGAGVNEVAQDYRIEPEDVQAALHYAAELARNRIVELPAGAA